METISKEEKFILMCDEINNGQRTVEGVLGNFKLRQYIPISEKFQIAENINIEVNLDFCLRKEETELDKIAKKLNVEDDGADTPSGVLNYYILKDKALIFSYLNLDITYDLIDAKTYDSICSSGIIEAIQYVVGADYKRFAKIIDEVTGMEYYALTSTLKDLILSVPTQEVADNFGRMLNSIDKQTIDSLIELQKFNNPILTNAVEQITSKIDEGIRNKVHNEFIK